MMNNYDYLLEKGKTEGIEKNVVGAIIINEDGKILIMSRKSEDFMGGIYELPSGNMEMGEDIITALAREVKEETNCDMKEILYYIDSFDYKSGSGKNARQYNFVIKVEQTDNIILTEHDAYLWQTTEEIIDNPKITNEVKETIKKYIKIKTEIVMITGNVGKYKVANDIFKENGMNLIQEKIETPEIQSYNVEDVSAYSAIYAAKKINKAVIKSDVGYFIPELNGFPGPFVKYINGMLSSEEILKLMENKTDRTIILKECLTYATPKGETKQFINEENATIALKAYGTGSAFDRIVIFNGQKLPKSMNTDEENLEHFKKTLKIYEDMDEYLKKIKI